MSTTPLATVAVFNASDDTVEMLVSLLTMRGYRALAGKADEVKSGVFDLFEFVTTQGPVGIIWDIAPPYDRNWTFFKLIKALAPLRDCALVVTTTNKQHLDRLVGAESGAIELVGKPYDLELIVSTLERMIEERARSTNQSGPRSLTAS